MVVRETRALLEQLPGLIDSIGSPAFADQLVDTARSLVRHDASALIVFPAAGPPQVLADRLRPGERRHLYGDYLSGVYLLSPFYRASLNLKTPRIARIAQIAPPGFAQSEYHRRYFALIGVIDLLGVLLPTGAGTLFLSFSRSTGQPRFTAAETRPLAGVTEVLAAAARRHATIAGSLIAAPGTARQSNTEAMEPRPATLTARESEVVHLLLQGHSSRAAAGVLGISVETIRVHRRNVYDKLGVTSQAGLFHWFLTRRT